MHLCEVPDVVKPTETGGRMVTTRGRGERKQGATISGTVSVLKARAVGILSLHTLTTLHTSKLYPGGNVVAQQDKPPLAIWESHTGALVQVLVALLSDPATC